MKKYTLILFLLVSYLCAKVHVATLDEIVDYGMKNLVDRAFENADDEDTVIFIMNTDGGRVDAAIDIADQIFAAPQTTIAFVEQRAISAGALISVACNSIVMKKGSTIGDCAPIMMGQEGPEMLGEKFQSPLRAKFRVYANSAGYPETLAEAMVSIDMQIYKVTIGDSTAYLDSVAYAGLDSLTKENAVLFVKKGELLTFSNYEAERAGFSKASYASFETYMESEEMVVSGSDVKRSPFVTFVSSLFPLLLVIGMAAVFIESKVPGIGLPGVIGVVCLTIAFVSKFMVGLAGGTEIILLAVGFVLLAAEIFIFPGFGIAGIAGIICIAIAGVLAMQDFVLPASDNPQQIKLFKENLQVIGYSFLGSILLIIGFFAFVFPRLNVVAPGTILTHDLSSVVDEKVTRKKEERQALIGKIAEVAMELRPSGSVKIEGKMYDATSTSFYIDKGKTVSVTGVKGSYLVVEEVEA